MKLEGKTYEELKTEIQQFLEHPPMILLPGGTWCYFCQTEICRNNSHRRIQLLLIALDQITRALAEERQKTSDSQDRILDLQDELSQMEN